MIAAFLRHGEYEQPKDVPSAWLPYPLTAKGLSQAREAARDMLNTVNEHQWRLEPVIDSSQLLRGWQTAATIAEEADQAGTGGLSVDAYDALAERSVGAAANLTVGAIERLVAADPRYDAPPKGWKSDSDYRLPLQGAESLMEAGRRVARHVEKRMAALAETADENTLKLFVGHGAAFRHAAVHLGVLSADDVGQLSMYHCRPVYLETDGHGVWRHLMGPWKQRNPGEEADD